MRRQISSIVHKLTLWGALVLVGMSLAITAIPEPVAAQGEAYTWATYSTITVTGGDLKSPATLTASSTQANRLQGILNYKVGCNIPVWLNITSPVTGTTGLLTIQQTAGMQNECGPDIENGYNNKTITTTNPRPTAGNDPETPDQMSVTVRVNSPSPASQSPPSVAFTFKDSTGKTVDSLASGQQSIDRNPDAGAKVVYYQVTAQLPPGDYSVCFSDIVGCQNFKKIKYQAIPLLEYGENLSNRTINVKLQLTIAPRPDPISIGAATISIEDAANGSQKRNIYTTDCKVTDQNSNPACLKANAPAGITVELTGAFTNIDPGTYKVCVDGTTICKTVAKESDLSTEVVLTASGDDAKQIAGQTSQEDACDAAGFDLGWIVCAAIRLISHGVETFDTLIIDMLTINTDAIFNPSGSAENEASSTAFRKAWGVFRNIALALVLIIGLIMVVAQIADLELFSELTLRKLPIKLTIAIIAALISLPILQFLFTASNDSAYAVMEAIKGPFQGVNVGSVSGISDFGIAFLIFHLIGIAGAGAVFYAMLSPMSVLAIVASVALFAFSAIVLLGARTALADLIIIISPLAIICGAFEPFKKLFTFWRTILLAILLSVPAVAAVITISHVAALIAYLANTPIALLIAIAIFIAGYAMIWTIFVKLDYLAGQIGNVTSAVTQGAQKALSNYRQKEFSHNWGLFKEGRRGPEALRSIGLGIGTMQRMREEGDPASINPFNRESWWRNHELRQDQMSVQSQIVAERIAGHASSKITKYDDDKLQAQMFRTAEDARHGDALAIRHGYFRQDQGGGYVLDENTGKYRLATAADDGMQRYSVDHAKVERAIGRAEASGGFNIGAAVHAFEQASATGTTFKTYQDALDAIDHIAGDDERLRGQLAAKLKVLGTGSGRVDFGAGIGDIAAAAGELRELSTALEAPDLAPGQRATLTAQREALLKRLDHQLTVKAGKAQDAVTILRGKTSGVERIAKEINVEVQAANEVAQAPVAIGDISAQERAETARNDVADMTLLLDSLRPATNYASLDNTNKFRTEAELPTRSVMENVERALQPEVPVRVQRDDPRTGGPMYDTYGNPIYDYVPLPPQPGPPATPPQPVAPPPPPPVTQPQRRGNGQPQRYGATPGGQPPAAPNMPPVMPPLPGTTIAPNAPPQQFQTEPSVPNQNTGEFGYDADPQNPDNLTNKVAGVRELRNPYRAPGPTSVPGQARPTPPVTGVDPTRMPGGPNALP